VQKILPLVFAFAMTAVPVLALGEGVSSFSKKIKTSQEAQIGQIEKTDSSNN
tara:strand:+ start:94 stop:249 length:156 start_codon:yes stop_codon:yes gene_type:complete